MNKIIAIVLLPVLVFPAVVFAENTSTSKPKGDFFRITNLTEDQKKMGRAPFDVRTLSGGGEDILTLSESLLDELDHKKALKEVSKRQDLIKKSLDRVDRKYNSMVLSEKKQLQADLREQNKELLKLKDLMLDTKEFGFSKKTILDAASKAKAKSLVAQQIYILAYADRVTDVATWMQAFSSRLTARVDRSDNASLTASLDSYKEALTNAKSKVKTASNLVQKIDLKAEGAEAKLTEAAKYIKEARGDVATARTALKTLLQGTSSIVN